MRVFTIQDDDAERAQAKLTQDLGITAQDVRLLKREPKACSFEVITCPASIDVEISRDGMKAFLRKIRLPIGEKARKLNTDLMIELLKEKGIVSGLKLDFLSKEIYKILNTPGFDESQPLNWLVAEGVPPVSGQAGRPQWVLDLKVFKEKNPVVFARKGEVIARAPSATKGQEGFRVTGEIIKPVLEEQFRLNVGQGIEIQQNDTETLYLAKSFGRLFYDEGVRLRLESKLTDMREGMDAAATTMQKSFSGVRITANDLINFAKDNGVNFGFLSPNEIEAQLKAAKQWPATILIAKGQDAVDGAPGEILHLYKKPASDSPLDIERAKEKIVFPQEDILILKAPRLPTEGKTAFGEILRGRPFSELALYPGKNVIKEKRGDDVVFKAGMYGRVVVDKERVSVENSAKVTKQGMEVVIDLFPQKLLSQQDILNVLRDIDVLTGFDKDKLERDLVDIFKSGDRKKEFKIASGKPASGGTDARLDYFFDKEEFKEKGLFQKKSGRLFFAAPGDLLMTKILPMDAQEGMNVFRDKVPVPKSQMPKDIPMKSGENIREIELGEPGNEKDPPRIEFRADRMGTLIWKEGFVDISPTLSFSKDEREAKLKIAPKSDFGTVITEEMIKKMADEEGIKVDLDWPEIRKFLKMRRESDDSLPEVVIAKAVDPKHGENARIQYFVEYNGKPIESLLGQRKTGDEKPLVCDCVRPGDVLAMKTPAGLGVDGKTIFGRRLPAERGLDEVFLIGFGVEKSKDGLQIYSSLTSPGYAMVEGGKLVIRSTVQIAKDKMSATVSIFPSKNPRFMVREEKIISMLNGAGVSFGIRQMTLRDVLEEVLETEKPAINVLIAEGRKPEKGRDTTFRFAVDVGDGVGEMRADGSVDFKNRNIFQSVRKGQLLVIKQPPVQGADGIDVCGNILPGKMGADANLQAGSGVEVTENGLEYRSTISGILEIQTKSIKVIPGLFIATDVGTKTGNIHGATAQVFIKGGVLPDFEVTSDGDISIEKDAEACRVMAKGALKVRGGIIGKNKGFYSSKATLEANYITAGANVECESDILIRSEILNSKITTGGMLVCEEGAGAIVGGEIFAYRGIRAKVLGAAGAETPTTINLGENVFALRVAEQEVREKGIAKEIEELKEKLRPLTIQLKTIYDSIPEISKTNLQEGQKLQTEYRKLFDQRQEMANKLDVALKKRDEILEKVPLFKDFVVTVTDLIHPGTVFIYKDVKWVLKEPIRGVEIRWNVATSNFISKRL